MHGNNIINFKLIHCGKAKKQTNYHLYRLQGQNMKLVDFLNMTVYIHINLYNLSIVLLALFVSVHLCVHLCVHSLVLVYSIYSVVCST